MEFVRRSHERCDEIEHASKTIASLKEDYAELRARFAPYAAAKDGITRRVKELGEARDRLAADIDALQQTPQGGLAARVQAFADDKKKLDDGVAEPRHAIFQAGDAAQGRRRAVLRISTCARYAGDL